MDIQNPVSDSLRIDYSRTMAYTGPEVPKLTFGQRLKRGLAKFGSFLGSFAGIVAPLFGPWGAIAGAASYGLRSVSNRSLYKSTSKDNYDMATQAQNSMITVPGFMDGPQTTAGGFVAPSHLAPSIEDVVIQSESTKQNMMRSL